MTQRAIRLTLFILLISTPVVSFAQNSMNLVVRSLDDVAMFSCVKSHIEGLSIIVDKVWNVAFFRNEDGTWSALDKYPEPEVRVNKDESEFLVLQADNKIQLITNGRSIVRKFNIELPVCVNVTNEMRRIATSLDRKLEKN